MRKRVSVPDFIGARAALVEALREELVGPAPAGRVLPEGAVEVDGWGPYRQDSTGEEIITGDRPTKRYGVGVLHPVSIETLGDGALGGEEGDRPQEDSATLVGASVQSLVVDGGDVDGDDDLALPSSNDLRPSSMGLTFLLADTAGDLRIEVSAGRYEKRRIVVRSSGGAHEATWWFRRPVRADIHLSAADLRSQRRHPQRIGASEEPSLGPVEIEVLVVARPQRSGDHLVTVALVNRSSPDEVDAHSLFQVSLAVEVPGEAAIRAYENLDRPHGVSDAADPEVASLNLLYRGVQSFAIGHGCSADWEVAEDGLLGTRVIGTPFPVIETPSTSPDVIDPRTGQALRIDIAAMASLDAAGMAELSNLADAYDHWIQELAAEAKGLSPQHREAGHRHIDACREASRRIRRGIEYLDGDADAREAFRLANQAILDQQGRSAHPPRSMELDESAQRLRFADPPPSVSRGGSWRAFQIGFLLASLRSSAEVEDPERAVVELIFFPTGGGKTEAYLALAAFSAFRRRLADPGESGTDTIMRYTLRLLTQQQFQRVGALICAMELLRRADPARLGEEPFSLGMWVGGGASPNRRADALRSLAALQRREPGVVNPFVLLKCPWCAAPMGPFGGGARRRARAPRVSVVGYRAGGEPQTVRFHCPDAECPFHRGLPVRVIDEDIYEYPPTIVIGTVDKFANLTRRPEARSLFGIGPTGARVSSPPNLIIQDELHLIAGPLGSMVGIYESLIHELCCDRRGAVASLPKIVASTATIRRYAEQVKGLYAREEVRLFPPPGLDASDSFFARYAEDGESGIAPGRLYVGVHAASLSSVQTAQVRTLASLLQGARLLPEDVRDPWWTLLAFFNSLRELGTSVSLLQADIPDYFKVLRRRMGFGGDEYRYLNEVMELTSRMSSDQIPLAISRLETSMGSRPSAIDVCLASNIVEVGVDVPRLSLMTVMGQPKTTSQYIQATGRVGRNWWDRPGLVVTILSPSKPRDRSHFERFRAYHERLYAQVEPTSVTPFAPPVLDRALPGVMAAFVRQFGPVDVDPRPVPDALLEDARRSLEARVALVDPSEQGRFASSFAGRLAEWRRWGHPDWFAEGAGGDAADPLLRTAGDYVDPNAARFSWPVPSSMRAVDATCRAAVSNAYRAETP